MLQNKLNHHFNIAGMTQGRIPDAGRRSNYHSLSRKHEEMKDSVGDWGNFYSYIMQTHQFHTLYCQQRIGAAKLLDLSRLTKDIGQDYQSIKTFSLPVHRLNEGTGPHY